MAPDDFLEEAYEDRTTGLFAGNQDEAFDDWMNDVE
jgi:hypothetical protein